ncbi:MAG: Na+/H+ antiporter subunit E [Verrucomicrobia bacterium]|nr:Na+/H+ antiporter subunit E [Kiritimatiellia bacterium]MCB1100877.1 Na+/H+ antiporter subunit E [Kiritimatiellia bacterium]MCP5487590.1 Na+/H+ antiporter subunit E [Verrucomicrobiota bacterium]
MSATLSHPSGLIRARSLAIRLVLFAAGWLILTEGDLRDLWIGGAVVLLGVAASCRVLAPGTLSRLRWGGLLRFTVFFLIESLRGGIDVAWRALHPAMPLSPGWTEVTLALRGEGSRVLLAWTVSLLPGTASVHLDGHRLVVHVLCEAESVDAALRRLEKMIEGLSGA